MKVINIAITIPKEPWPSSRMNSTEARGTSHSSGTYMVDTYSGLTLANSLLASADGSRPRRAYHTPPPSNTPIITHPPTTPQIQSYAFSAVLSYTVTYKQHSLRTIIKNHLHKNCYRWRSIF